MTTTTAPRATHLRQTARDTDRDTARDLDDGVRRRDAAMVDLHASSSENPAAEPASGLAG